MRIPFDYYQILGIPQPINDDQLHQAYQDRRVQLPRREYSDVAICARKRLLDEAYAVLGDPTQRANYEQELAQMRSGDLSSAIDPSSETAEPPESFSPTGIAFLEVAEDNLIGALLILQELGEYEVIIELGETILVTCSLSETERNDICLTIALAHLELSREQWQKREYENAAMSGNQGLELLKEKEIFSQIQQEIAKELHWLRPYRILELLSQPLTRIAERRMGLTLLREMLEQRQGIEGKGDDASGLSVDDFLRFIQQLRVYLTLEEQEELFEAEAQRSWVASYLLVCTLIGQGVYQKQPQTIVKANTLLQNLSKKEDVSLEQGICALLLGQTEVANHALAQSRESEPIKFIRSQSVDAPDLLPGLYIYTQRWLETEVFSHFRDLLNQTASLTDYFADKAVIAYLEAYLVQANSSPPVDEQSEEKTMANPLANSTLRSSKPRAYPRQASYAAHGEESTAASVSRGRTATLTVPKDSFPSDDSSATKEDSERLVITSSYRESTPTAPRQRKRRKPSSAKAGSSNRHPRRRRRQSSLKIKPLVLLLGVVGGIGLLGLMVNAAWQSRSPLSSLQGEQLSIQLAQPPLAIPAADSRILLPSGKLSPDTAKQVIEAWLTSKSLAFGTEHQVNSIDSVLVEPLASTWRNRAETLKRSNSHWTYQHNVEIKSLTVKESNPDRAVVVAQVQEIGNFYQKGQLNANRSYDDNLRVQYILTRQQDQWFIQDIRVL